MANGDEETPHAPDEAPADAFAHPMRRHLTEYLLGKDRDAVGMTVVVNEAARFKAGSDGETLDDITLQTVREELEEYHIPVLEDEGVLDRDPDADTLSLTPGREGIRQRLEAAKATAERHTFK